MKTLDFFFGDHEVGCFELPTFPRAPGCYPYEAYRGPGHYDMWQELEARGLARCYFIDGTERVSFWARDAGDQGLELSDFRIEEHYAD